MAGRAVSTCSEAGASPLVARYRCGSCRAAWLPAGQAWGAVRAGRTPPSLAYSLVRSSVQRLGSAQGSGQHVTGGFLAGITIRQGLEASATAIAAAGAHRGALAAAWLAVCPAPVAADDIDAAQVHAELEGCSWQGKGAEGVRGLARGRAQRAADQLMHAAGPLLQRSSTAAEEWQRKSSPAIAAYIGMA